MIRELHLCNFLFIGEARLAFVPGLNVITGETGAGKSVLLEGLKLVLGKRGRAGLALDPARPARVQAIFDLATAPQARAVVAELGLLSDDDPDQLTVARSFRGEGGGQCWINGILAQAVQLQRIGVGLLEIHGQNEHQALLQSATQRRLLDRFGGPTQQERLDSLARAFRTWDEAQRARSALTARLAQAVARLEELREVERQLAELDLRAIDEVEQLQAEEQRLGHAEQLGEAMRTVLAALDGEGDGAGVGPLLGRAREAARRAARHAGELAAIATGLDGLLLQFDELRREAGRFADRLTPDPRRLDQVAGRLAEIARLCRRHATDPAGLVGLRAKVTTEIGELTAPDDAQRRATANEDQAAVHYREQALAVGAARRELGARLAREVGAELPALGFARAVIEPRFTAQPPGPAGLESVDFWVALNPGAPAAPLAAVASGGELSRLALALKTVLGRGDDMGTLVFDEVDAGIGGTTAEQVAGKLVGLATQRQVVLVTHLHQIAKEADRHFAVSKDVREEKTVVEINQLSDAERTEEIARMLGTSDAAGRDFARRLLQRSRSAGSEVAGEAPVAPSRRRPTPVRPLRQRG